MNTVGRFLLTMIIFDVGAMVAGVVRDGYASSELMISFGVTAIAFIFLGGKNE